MTPYQIETCSLFNIKTQIPVILLLKEVDFSKRTGFLADKDCLVVGLDFPDYPEILEHLGTKRDKGMAEGRTVAWGDAVERIVFNRWR